MSRYKSFLSASCLISLIRNVLYWLWVPLIQERLDEFREYNNNHRLKPSKDKLLPSGRSPRHVLISPETVRTEARDCSIKVNPEMVHRIREEYGGEKGRDYAFRFITREFEAEADDAYVDLGKPAISLSSAWDVFTAVVNLMTSRREEHF